MGPTCIPKMPLGFLRREEARQTSRMEGGIPRVDGVSTKECYLLSCLRHSCLILSQLAEDHRNDSQEVCHRTVKKESVQQAALVAVHNDHGVHLACAGLNISQRG